MINNPVVNYAINSIKEMDMPSTKLNRQEVCDLAKSLYASKIKEQVEIPENIGKMVIIDVGSGDYGVDKTGFGASKNIRSKHPDAQLFGIRIGYDVSATIGGSMKRTS